MESKKIQHSVIQLYNSLLGREPDPNGLRAQMEDFSNYLEKCHDYRYVYNCMRHKIMQSAEYITKHTDHSFELDYPGIDNRTKKAMELIYYTNQGETKALCNLDILLLTMGKSGSSSINHSFWKNGYNSTHLHSLEHVYLRVPKLRENRLSINFEEIIKYNKIVRNKKPLLISLYREPISAYISHVFHYFYHAGNAYGSDDIYNHFKIRPLNPWNYIPFLQETVFDNICDKHMFDQDDEGYIYIERKEKCNILLLRFDALSRFEDIIRKILRNPNFFIIKANENESKQYAHFKKYGKIPKDILDSLFYIHKEVLEYFYTEKKIGQLKAKWYGRQSEPNYILSYPDIPNTLNAIAKKYKYRKKIVEDQYLMFS